VTPSEAMLEQQEGDIPVVAVGGGSGGSLRLPPFWPHALQLWFSQAECLFTVNNVSDQFYRYCLVVASLQHDSLRRVADIVEAPPAGVAYDTIKQRLLASHQMTGFQRAERLFAMPALGARKPSELMAEMLEICPRGKERRSCLPAYSCSGCRARFVCCWLGWITRTRRS
jgi:hypothetical protein